jgi:predicted glutamine amidotransferase
MCELLGLCFNQPVLPSLSFRGFRRRGRHNPDGWGLAAWRDGATQIFKEPVRADDSCLAAFVRDYPGLESRVFIAHVRFATEGGKSLANTHPFGREVAGRDLVLAHNGTLQRHRLDPMLDGLFTPVGETDSEAALCVLAGWLVGRRVPFDAYARIHDRLRDLNGCGRMNLLFSEGRRLYAYCDDGGAKGLSYTRRAAPFGPVALRDEDREVDLGAQKRPGQCGHVVATQPLTDEPWHRLAPGALLVFEAGEIVYPA